MRRNLGCGSPLEELGGQIREDFPLKQHKDKGVCHVYRVWPGARTEECLNAQARSPAKSPSSSDGVNRFASRGCLSARLSMWHRRLRRKVAEPLNVAFVSHPGTTRWSFGT